MRSFPPLPLVQRLSTILLLWARIALAREADETLARPGGPIGPVRSVVRVGESAPHSAFTDLVRWRDRWWCVYREGQDHVSPDGAIRVLVSEDGRRWSTAARLTSVQGDLRDPHVTRMPDGRLMLYGAVARPAGGAARHQSLAWFSADGREWSAEVPVGDPNVWLWRVVWNGPEALGVGYDTEGERFVRLYASRDGRNFASRVEFLQTDPNPNEAGLAFLPDGTAVCLLRRDGQPGTAKLGISRPPHREWNWRDLGVRIGGPQLIRLPDGRLVAGVRLHDGAVRTSICRVDLEAGRIREVVKLPSGGDCSYPGLVWHEGELWTSYYSSHEGRSMVYVARVVLPD